MKKKDINIIDLVNEHKKQVRDNVKLSEQAIAVLGTCLMKVLAEGKHIDSLLSPLNFFLDGDGELFITNPPDRVEINEEFLKSTGEEVEDEEVN